MGLALITGSGALPAVVAAAVDPAPVICSLEGFLPDDVTPDLVFRLEHLGSLIDTLRERGVERVCFCGAVTRPEIDPTQIDEKTQPLVEVLQRALQPGDDGALRAIMGVFETAGFTIQGAHEIAPELLPPSGVLTRRGPDEGVAVEMIRARAVLGEMARRDEGQACVLRGETVLAQEDARGTDAMLADLAAPRAKPLPSAVDPFNWVMDTVGEVLDDTSDWLAGDGGEKAARKGAGGALFKGPKPGQDLRADLPTIGPETVRGAARAGLRGIVIDAGGVMVLDRAEVVALCDEAGLFLIVRAFR